MLSEACSRCLGKALASILEVVLEGSATSFCNSDGVFMHNLKKHSFGVFLTAETSGLRSQKQANRTVHPSKIKDGLAGHTLAKDL